MKLIKLTRESKDKLGAAIWEPVVINTTYITSLIPSSFVHGADNDIVHGTMIMLSSGGMYRVKEPFSQVLKMLEASFD